MHYSAWFFVDILQPISSLLLYVTASFPVQFDRLTVKI